MDPGTPNSDQPKIANVVQRELRNRDSGLGGLRLADIPHILLHVLTSAELDPRDLAKLEATCSWFSQPANFYPYLELSIPERAALDMCEKRTYFRSMTVVEQQHLKERCGGSWKLVLKFLLAGEALRKRKSQAIAGSGHSIVVTSKGAVYSFGSNTWGQLGLGTTHNEFRPQLISSLQGICIVQVAVGYGKTLLVSDAGKVYIFGRDILGEPEFEHEDEDDEGDEGEGGIEISKTPKQVDDLENIFVVQATIAHFFTAVLSREGRVYTLCWGSDGNLGHETDPVNRAPSLLLGELENVPVVQIAAGYCYLVALACKPSGMCVYSLGCGLGGKLGHGSLASENSPRMIKEFQRLNFRPIEISASAWHAAVLGQDGRVCTWGWGHFGCLGHGNDEFQLVPKVVEAITHVKAVHVATGDGVTFVVTDNGSVYSCGYVASASLQGIMNGKLFKPSLVTSLPNNERVVQISHTKFLHWYTHTFVVTESGKLYAFGARDRGQLGIQFDNQTVMEKPELVNINLN